MRTKVKLLDRNKVEFKKERPTVELKTLEIRPFSIQEKIRNFRTPFSRMKQKPNDIVVPNP